MEASERDSTRDWLLPEHSGPPLIRDLEARVEEALATARASESAVMTVGAAALDAAEQARRAADLAERASAAMLGGHLPTEPAATASPAREESPPAAGVVEDGSLRDFSARADRIAARLRELERGSVAVVG